MCICVFPDFPAGGRDIQVVPPGPGIGGIPPVAHMDKPYPTEDVDPQVLHMRVHIHMHVHILFPSF